MSEYSFKTKPFDHQRDIFDKRRDLVGDALFLEQGTGKSKCILDNAADLFLRGEIDAVLVIAPNGVQRNWVTDEIPAHLPDAVAENTRSLCWQSTKAGSQKFARELDALMAHRGLTFIAMSYDATITLRGKAFVKRLLASRTVLYVLDEATRIKTPGAKRTKYIVASGTRAKYRRILTGTPVTNGPFDVYSPIRFSHPTFWKTKGLGDFFAFKTFFGLFEKKTRSIFNPVTGKQKLVEYNDLLEYRNLDLLKKYLDEVSVRVLKDDVLDLPPKLYSTRYFEPTREQMRLYNDLTADYIALLADGREVIAALAIVRLLRFQQALCGYLPTNKTDEDGYISVDTELVELPGGNPRLALLLETCEDTPHKAIIWAKFTKDIDLITQGLRDLKLSFVRYDGKVGDDQRAANKIAFQNGDAQFFVGNPAAAGIGLTLHAAKTVIYYNNTFKLEERLQSEDRVHRAGLKHPVQYIDIVAQGTVDEDILRSLRSKIDVASTITGDTLKGWVL